MPEGDTVWLAAKRLDAALAGQVLTRSDFRVPSLATVDLVGALVHEVRPRGKHLLARMTLDDSEVTLHSHFRMDGSWHLYRPGDRWAGPTHSIRAILGTADIDVVGYRMPVLELLSTKAEDTVVGHLGPDLLGPDWDESEALRRLRVDPSRAIGEALLDQRNLAGIGNLYKSESLFMRGVSPWASVGDVDAELPALVEQARKLLELNKDRSIQSTTGDLRRGGWHWVFERGGQPCRRCGTKVETAWQGEPPRARFTYRCPKCQPGEGPIPLSARDIVGLRTVGRTRYRP